MPVRTVFQLTSGHFQTESTVTSWYVPNAFDKLLCTSLAYNSGGFRFKFLSCRLLYLPFADYLVSVTTDTAFSFPPSVPLKHSLPCAVRRTTRSKIREKCLEKEIAPAWRMSEK